MRIVNELGTKLKKKEASDRATTAKIMNRMREIGNMDELMVVLENLTGNLIFKVVKPTN